LRLHRLFCFKCITPANSHSPLTQSSLCLICALTVPRIFQNNLRHDCNPLCQQHQKIRPNINQDSPRHPTLVRHQPSYCKYSYLNTPQHAPQACSFQFMRRHHQIQGTQSAVSLHSKTLKEMRQQR